ncbi:hypothetical protein T439DRAFT_375778 [Meredithblackwellia eburnea MCA 4105]
MAPAYLWVLADPGQAATVDEFNDWYDNEHVPLRLEHISEFLTGARYQAADGLTPGWAAAYDIQDTSLFSDPKYTVLRANRSPREAALVVRLDPLDRRTAETLGATSPPALDPKDAAKFTLTVASETEPKWQGTALEKVKGWKRTHAHKIYDSLRTNHGKEPVSGQAPKFVTIYEFDDESYVDTPEYKEAIAGSDEARRWKLYKATPNTAPPA